MLGQIINLVNNNYFKAFLLLRVQLLTPSDLLDQLLNDNFVMVVCLAGRDLNVVVTREYYAFDCSGPTRTSLKFLKLRFNFVHCICLIELLEDTFSERSLAATGGTI